MTYNKILEQLNYYNSDNSGKNSPRMANLGLIQHGCWFETVAEK